MTHIEVLNSDLPIPANHPVQLCRECGKTAQRYWPCVSCEPEPYCETCLIEAKTRLEIALGSANPL